MSLTHLVFANQPQGQVFPQQNWEDFEGVYYL